MRKIDHDRELYECECGKTYWSYSALYVHAMMSSSHLAKKIKQSLWRKEIKIPWRILLGRGKWRGDRAQRTLKLLIILQLFEIFLKAHCSAWRNTNINKIAPKLKFLSRRYSQNIVNLRRKKVERFHPSNFQPYLIPSCSRKWWRKNSF